MKSEEINGLYTLGVEWIALNDEPSQLDWNQIKHLTTVVMLADLFSIPNEIVAVHVANYRKAHEIGICK